MWSDIQCLEVIGRGTYGTVYKAFWNGSFVAAKVVPVNIEGGDFSTLEKELNALRYFCTQ